MHDAWARHYDFVYDECFGDAFRQLTADTLALLAELQPSPARVLDLGAGTGRLALPLARQGYGVSAVEASVGMAEVLAERASAAGLLAAGPASPQPAIAPGGWIDLRPGDFRNLTEVLRGESAGGRAGPFDLAMAIFTVLNYLVAADDLRALAAGVSEVLRPGGHVVFDLAARRLFAPALFESERLHREIRVEPAGPHVFTYRDAGCGARNGTRFQYEETFTLRYWRDGEVLPVFADAGLELRAEVTGRLAASGSRWFVLERRALSSI